MKVIWEANNISLSLSVAHLGKFLRSRQNLLYLFNYFGAGLITDQFLIWLALIKDGAYYCYCAYVLRISRYSDFLLLVLINTGIFLRGSKL